MRLATFVSRQKPAILISVGLLSIAGVWAATVLPTAIFPETDFPRVVVSLDAGEMPSAQMLATVTRPVEEALNGIPGVEHIRSDTGRGAAQIDVFFNWSVDVILSQQYVDARLSQMRTELPPDVKVETTRLTFAVFPILGYSLTSDTRDPANLREIAAFELAPRLSRLPGIASVKALGGKVREYHVVIDPVRLQSSGLGLPDVADAVTKSNVLASSGLVEENHALNLVLVSGQVTRPEDLGAIVVGTSNGNPVTLAQLATIEPGVRPEYIIVTADGKPAVLLNVVRQPDANTIAVADAIKAELDLAKTELPPDIRVAPFYDQSLIVRGAIGSVRDAIAIGLALSVLILYLFLRDWRMTVVATAVIPVTVLVTFLAMKLAGLGFDLMTLGGVAAAIGLVIDDAIVVVENIHVHLGRGEDRRAAVATAVSELVVPIIGSTLTPVVVFLPLSILTGVTGVFFRALALTMVVALLTSLVLALSFTPAIAERFVRVRAKSGEQDDGHARSGPIFGRVAALYDATIRRALGHPAIVLIVAALVLAGGIGLYRFAGSDFLPGFDEGAFVLDYLAPPGSSLEETDRILRRVESILTETPEVESYSRRTGAELGLFVTEPNTGDFLVKLKADRSRTTEEVKSEIREQIAEEFPADVLEVELPGILVDLINDLISSSQPIEIKVFSDDADALRAKAEEIQEVLDAIPGVVDTNSGVVVSGPAITLQVDQMRAAALGVSATDVADAAETALAGRVASSILERGRLVDIRVLVTPEASRSVEALRALPIRSAASGATFRLEQVADVHFDPGQTELHRENLRESVVVTAATENLDLGTAIARIRKAINEKVVLPPRMTVEYGGIYEEQQAAFRSLAASLALAVVLVFLVLLVEFRSFAAPTAIVVGSVLALPGVLAGIVLTGLTLNVVSFMGAIMVVGIVAKNGILMLDTVGEHLSAGESLIEALVSSGQRRLRPVLMTSLAAILGMLPLAIAIGEGAQLLQPLAISVIGGLLLALVLSLVVTPTLYMVLARRGVQNPER